MQVLDVQQSSPTPYTPAGGTYNNNPVPGAGGLPSLSGLNNRMNPMAQELQGQGRGGDSVLVHMTPNEVNSLQGLAMAMGGSLTINPETGLPEANILKKLLPTILGAALAATGIGAPLAAGIVGLGQTALTGDISKGLMAGLGAFGGGSLAGAAGLGGAISNNAFGALGSKAGIFGANMGAGATAGALGAGKAAAANILPGDMLAEQLASKALPIPGDMLAEQLASQVVPAAGGLGATAPAAAAGKTGFLSKFGATAKQGLGKGMLAKYAPYAAGLGLYSGLSEASMPTGEMPGQEEEDERYKYKGPYYPPPRVSRFRTPEEMERTGGAAFGFFEPGPPPVPRMAEGGVASLPAAGDFQAAVDFFSRNSPGAITASMYPPAYVKPPPLNRKTSDPATGTGGGAGPNTNSGTVGEAASTSRSSPNTNYGGGANAIDLATMYGGRMSSEIASGPPSNNPLPGTRIPGVNVSGQGVMPDYKLEDLTVNPVGTPQINVSSGYYPSNNMFNYRGASPFSDIASNMYGGSNNLNSMSSFGNNLDTRISGGNYGYGFPTGAFKYDYGLPTSIFKDPEEFEELKARGGEVGMDDGSFVVDARTVSEMGNGSSNAGIERLAAMGGRPVRGGGDGVSDSVPARIGGKQKARVARDEVIFSPEAVARVGGGNHSKGTKKLYALMDKAHKARKKAGRGQDTKVAKGLGGLA
jgi:hypothetical protein